ncbi:MAG: hypothetical protein ACXWIN_04365 [Burkholderiaceae bacterium]
MNETGKSPVVVFPTGQYPSELIEPYKQPLNLPGPFVPAQSM